MPETTTKKTTTKSATPKKATTKKATAATPAAPVVEPTPAPAVVSTPPPVEEIIEEVVAAQPIARASCRRRG